MFGSVFAQSDYYWYKGKKVFLTKTEEKKFVLFENNSTQDVSQQRKVNGASIKASGEENFSKKLKPYKGNSYQTHKWAIVETQSKSIDLSSEKNISYQAPSFISEENVKVTLSNLFYVKLRKASDIHKLESLAKKYKVEIVGNNEFMPLWYTLSCSGSSRENSMEIANKFYESTQFEAAEPDFVSLESLELCTNDTFFGNQWGLDNTNTNPGNTFDINFCEARQITSGDANITIAVLDHGIDMSHADLPNISPFSYDTPTGGTSTIRGNHGTACAGIIGAAGNNSIGVTGIAPDCPLMSISDPLQLSTNAPQQLADGFNFAWQNGAAVISNSWGHNLLASSLIDDAITNTLTNGRGGLGTIVVFSAGNGNANVNYPANSNPNIIAVGAMSPCGERKNPSSCDGETWWGSDFGTQLDVVAPGVLIPTTDRSGSAGYRSGDYTQNFNGTSSACPHVAALAGLILSVNPSLTQREVADIIEQTAQKVGGYNYQNTSGRPNGTWDDEMGYGLIDAEAAVLAAGGGSTTDLLDEFNVPRSSGIPTGFRKYSNVHTIGTGGPDLSNVFNSVFNWWGNSGNPNGLYQFTLETTDGNPSHYTDMVQHASYSLHQSNPDIDIYSSVGFTNLDGEYWINLDGSNLVLVEKSGDYALYFSNSSTPPSLRRADLGGMENVFAEDLMSATASPNPFSNSIEVHIPESMGAASLTVVDSKGTPIENLSTEGGNVSLGSSYAPGIYMIKVIGETGVEQLTVIKQ